MTLKVPILQLQLDALVEGSRYQEDCPDPAEEFMASVNLGRYDEC